MSTMMEVLRCTGRTTRMLKAAIEAAQRNPVRAMHVLARTEQEATRLLNQSVAILHKMGCEVAVTHLHLKLLGVGEIHFESCNDRNWDWESFGLRGKCSSNVFVDPAAIEAHFAKAVTALHQFDDPTAVAIIHQIKAAYIAAEQS